MHRYRIHLQGLSHIFDGAIVNIDKEEPGPLVRWEPIELRLVDDLPVDLPGGKVILCKGLKVRGVVVGDL